MSHRSSHSLCSALSVACLGAAAAAQAQAPASTEHLWPIPPDLVQQLPQEAIPAVREGSYDLPALIDLAERVSPQTRAAWEEARQAAAAVHLAESAYLPQISLEAIGGFQRTPLPAPATLVPKGYFISDTREAVPALAVKWLLFDFGRRAGAEQAARASSFAANVAFTGAHQKLVYEVSHAYFDLGAARGRLQAAQQALSTAQTTEQAATAMRTSGLATIVAQAQARRETAQARFNLAAAEGTERTAYAQLIASLGLPPGTRLSVQDSSVLPLPLPPAQTVAQAVRQALAQRPDVVAALGRIDAAEGTLKSERAAYYPTIAFSAQVFQNVGALSSDGSRYSSVNRMGAGVLLTLSLPLFDGGARSSRVAIARSRVREAEDRVQELRDQTTRDVVSAYNTLQTSLAQHEAAVALKAAAHTAYDAALRAYKQGVGTYTEVATEENAAVQADTAVADAHANAHTAAAALAFAMGAADGAVPPGNP